jgi:hypothetical protein
MKKSNLITFDVQELNTAEMKKYEGGIPLLVALLLASFGGSVIGSTTGLVGTAWYLSSKRYPQ